MKGKEKKIWDYIIHEFITKTENVLKLLKAFSKRLAEKNRTSRFYNSKTLNYFLLKKDKNNVR